jgi:hypothetical protein
VSGADEALESALLVALAADAGVTAALGDPLRLLDGASQLPGYPYLDIARRQSEANDSAGCESVVVTMDLVVMSRDEGGRLARYAIAQVRRALLEASLEMDGWRCVLLLPVFADALRQRIGLWRALLRIRAVVEKV